jgi:hypothetical protein
MISSQNSANLRFSISVSMSSTRKWQNQTKPQEFATATINAITRSRYTASVLMAMDHQRTRTKISEDPHSRQISELLTKDPPKTTSGEELQTMFGGEAVTPTFDKNKILST